MLEGNVALVTGGVSGIGLATVETFVTQGAKVVVSDIQDDAGAALESRFNGEVTFVHTDVTVEAEVEALVAATVERYGRLDVLFSNAGLGGDLSPLADLTAEGLQQTLALNLVSHASAFRHAGRQMVAQGTGGSLIATSSTSGVQSGWAAAAYSMAKAAVLSLVRSAALEFGSTGIRANAVVPGLILTPIHAKYAGIPVERSDEYLALLADKLGDQQLVHRAGQPQDVADAALFLASHLSTFISGVALPVDGGALVGPSVDFGPGVAAAKAELACNAKPCTCSIHSMTERQTPRARGCAIEGEEMQLEGKRIIVTGGSGGMGAEVIAVLTAEGATVTAVDLTDDPGQHYAQEAPGPGSATFATVDITDRDHVNRVFNAAIEDMGGLDCLINTAGVLRPHTTETVTDDIYDLIFDVNAKGTMISNQAVFQALRDNGGGTIINFGSISGLRPEPTSVLYSASKGAVHSWTRSLAHAWGEHGIRVNAILPIIATPMYRAAKEAMTAEQREQFERETEGGIPLGKAYGDSARDLGPVLVFFASNASRFITGQLIPVDGGLASVH